jgi:endonuclease/exonuclease/phosphatase family metal-dependent hydrolase
MRVKILQWNIWGHEKVENTLKLVKKINPDILCFQELMIGSAYNDKKDVAKIISEKTNFECNFALAHKANDDGRVLGNGIFSRYKIANSPNFFIADPKNSNDYSFQGRSCAVSEIKIRNNRSITIATAHSSYNNRFIENEAKLDEIKRLVNFFKKNTNRLVFTGDLNIAPNSELIRQIEKYMVHCGPDYKESTWTTKPFSYKGFEEDKLRWRLDYAFATKDIKVIDSKIIKTKYSDHLPILIEIEV